MLKRKNALYLCTFPMKQLIRYQNASPIASQWRAHCRPAVAMLAGLAAAQIIASLQVYDANQSLYNALTAIHGGGYLPVPNQKIMARLQDFSTAVYGGLFFTLSTGAGISLLSLAAAWLWERVFSRNTIFLLTLLFLWGGILSVLNWKGFEPFATLYFVVIPPVTFRAAISWMPSKTGKQPRHWGMPHLLPVILLAMLWAPQAKSHLFLNIRDHILLSNPLGEKIVNFYYQYTLYPAEILKTLDQKLQKTCALKAFEGGPFKKRLHKILLAHDWLDMGEKKDVDLILINAGDELLMDNGNGVVLRIPRNEFQTHPTRFLKAFSSATDKHRFFRQFTFWSLLIGFPVSLYSFLYWLLFLWLGTWISPKIAAAASAGICCSAGLALLICLWQGKVQTIDHENLGETLMSGNRRERLATLKMLREKRLDASSFEAYPRILKSPYIPERYWLAKALGVAQGDETRTDLVRLLDDPSPLVASRAFSALGRRGEQKALAEILKRIKTSEHWYSQWHAYKALKALGWHQTDADP